MNKKITISSIVAITLVVVSVTWYTYSNLASARAQLEDQQNALEQDKDDFKKEQEKFQKDLDEFKSDKEQFEKDKESLASEQKELKKKEEDMAVLQENSDQTNINETPTTEPDITEEPTTQTEPQPVEESQTIETPQATESEYIPETEPTITEGQEIYNQIAEIELALSQLESEKNNYPEWSEEYRNVIREQLELLEKKKELLQ
ncbi:hypothetical protein [Terribacillus sp. FSL K6-0262]|uniref:hypothetical protein n=1 Tax=Terribacillus sp. FSL K6-0262 TaxID=2921447 RepID=UPI0030EB7AA9